MFHVHTVQISQIFSPFGSDLWKGLKMATTNFIDCEVSRIARIMTIRIAVSKQCERLVGGKMKPLNEWEAKFLKITLAKPSHICLCTIEFHFLTHYQII